MPIFFLTFSSSKSSFAVGQGSAAVPLINQLTNFSVTGLLFLLFLLSSDNTNSFKQRFLYFVKGLFILSTSFKKNSMIYFCNYSPPPPLEKAVFSLKRA